MGPICRLFAALRRFYWRRVRRYRYEICGSVVAGTEGEFVIRRYGCGQPVRVVWTAPTWIWNRIVAPHAGDPIEGHGGILCPRCFDRAAEARGVFLRWVPQSIDHRSEDGDARYGGR